MDDRLVELLEYFELRARVFQAGPLCHSARYDGADGLSYIHVQRRGILGVESPDHPPLLIDEPSLFFHMNPTSHRLLPKALDVDMVCATIEFGASLRNPLARALPEMLLIRLRDMPTLDMSLTVLFDEPEDADGVRVLVDRLWPRGLSKQQARIDYWMKGIAPSSQLRKWYSHDISRWDEFKRRYFADTPVNRVILTLALKASSHMTSIAKRFVF